MNKILIPLDFSNTTPIVLDYVKKHLLKADAEICLLNVINEPGYISFDDMPIVMPESWLDEVKQAAEKKLDALKEQFLKANISKIKSELRVTRGPIYESILSCAADTKSSLIVIGSHSRNILERFLLGSVAEKLLRSATVPVLVVPPQ